MLKLSIMGTSIFVDSRLGHPIEHIYILSSFLLSELFLYHMYNLNATHKYFVSHPPSSTVYHLSYATAQVSLQAHATPQKYCVHRNNIDNNNNGCWNVAWHWCISRLSQGGNTGGSCKEITGRHSHTSTHNAYRTISVKPINVLVNL